jgi:hypothetical protein
MGFDHAIGLDSARQQICQRDLGRGDAYAAQREQARIGPDRNGRNLPALNQRVRGSNP